MSTKQDARTARQDEMMRKIDEKSDAWAKTPIAEKIPLIENMAKILIPCLLDNPKYEEIASKSVNQNTNKDHLVLAHGYTIGLHAMGLAEGIISAMKSYSALLTINEEFSSQDVANQRPSKS